MQITLDLNRNGQNERSYEKYIYILNSVPNGRNEGDNVMNMVNLFLDPEQMTGPQNMIL